MAGHAGQGAGDTGEPDVAGLLERGADRAIKAGLGGWWERRTENEKVATGFIAFGLALGPLGMGLLGAIGALFKDEIPSSKQLEAVFWLLIITAPLAAFVILFVWVVGKHAPFPVAAGAAAIAAVVAAGLMTNSSVPDKLSGLYCYAEYGGGRVAYERACHDFNSLGFVLENADRASPSGAGKVFGSAVAYTSDSRGSVMALASMMVAFGIGLLLRERA